MGKPETYAEAPQEIRDTVERLIRDFGSDPALLAGAMVSATCSAIAAAKKEEREACAALCQDSRYEWAEVAAKFADAIRKRGEA